MISQMRWEDFWEPSTAKHKRIKWTVIILTLFLSAFIFAINLNDIRAYEYACENPIIVEAEKKVVQTQGFLFEPCYEIYLSYTHNDVKYENVFLRSSRYDGTRRQNGEVVMVQVAPNDPSTPLLNMFNSTPVNLAVVLWSLGLSMLIYGSAIEFTAFRKWRVGKANRRGFFSRPYGKPMEFAANPDYLRDAAMIFILVMVLNMAIFALIFPHAAF